MNNFHHLLIDLSRSASGFLFISSVMFIITFNVNFCSKRQFNDVRHYIHYHSVIYTQLLVYTIALQLFYNNRTSSLLKKKSSYDQ
ncbi:hypothetical protein EDC94DRAFT_609968 [Helicostylum pulchrum]|nr:hypothetical protein EDC94DRAFT_609968 [Helicostylum pulchrum]